MIEKLQRRLWELGLVLDHLANHLGIEAWRLQLEWERLGGKGLGDQPQIWHTLITEYQDIKQILVALKACPDTFDPDGAPASLSVFSAPPENSLQVQPTDRCQSWGHTFGHSDDDGWSHCLHCGHKEFNELGVRPPELIEADRKHGNRFRRTLGEGTVASSSDGKRIVVWQPEINHFSCLIRRGYGVWQPDKYFPDEGQTAQDVLNDWEWV